MCKESFVIFKIPYIVISYDLFTRCLSLNLQCVCSPSTSSVRINGRFAARRGTNHDPALCIVGKELYDTTCLCVVISNDLRNKITIALKSGTELL